MITPRSRAIPDGYLSIKIAAVYFKAAYFDDGLGRLEFLIETGKLETFWVDDDLSVKKETSDFWKQQDLNKVLDMFSSGIFDFVTLGQPSGFIVRQILVFKQQLAGLLPMQQTPSEEVKTASNPVSDGQVVTQKLEEKNQGGRPAKHTQYIILACALQNMFNFKLRGELEEATNEEWAKRKKIPVSRHMTNEFMKQIFTEFNKER